MSMGQKLIQKLARRQRYVRDNADGFDRYERTDLRQVVLKKSERAFKLMVKPMRVGEASFGEDVLSHKPVLAYRMIATSVDRTTYDAVEGIQLTLPAGIISDSRIQPLDVVEILNGEAQGHYLTVVAIVDAEHLQLSDIPTYTGTESNIVVRAYLNGEIKSYY